MTVIGDQMVMSLANEANDRILIRSNPDTGEMELRYEPEAMFAEAFGERQAEACDHTSHVPTIAEEIDNFAKIEEMIAESSGQLMNDGHDWLSLNEYEAAIVPSSGYTEGEGEQAIVTTVGYNPAENSESLKGNPAPFG